MIALHMSPISSFFSPKASSCFTICCFLELLSSSKSIFMVRGDCPIHGVQGCPSLNHLSGRPWFPAQLGKKGFQHLGQGQSSSPAGPEQPRGLGFPSRLATPQGRTKEGFASIFFRSLIDTQ